jgi:hypothetical protein
MTFRVIAGFELYSFGLAKVVLFVEKCKIMTGIILCAAWFF